MDTEAALQMLGPVHCLNPKCAEVTQEYLGPTLGNGQLIERRIPRLMRFMGRRQFIFDDDLLWFFCMNCQQWRQFAIVSHGWLFGEAHYTLEPR